MEIKLGGSTQAPSWAEQLVKALCAYNISSVSRPERLRMRLVAVWTAFKMHLVRHR